MKFSTDKSIVLSRVCVILFSLTLAGLDVGAYWLVGFFIRLRGMNWQQGVFMMISIYVCSVFAWIVLYALWRLLKNIRCEDIFTADNVRYLRVISWCCFAVAFVCLVSCLYYLPFIIAAMAAAFMALIVRIVKNVFQQALSMKDELDFTV